MTIAHAPDPRDATRTACGLVRRDVYTLGLGRSRMLAAGDTDTRDVCAACMAAVREDEAATSLADAADERISDAAVAAYDAAYATTGDPWASQEARARAIASMTTGPGEWDPEARRWRSDRAAHCSGCGERTARCWCREDDEPAASADLEAKLAEALR